ncbi:MAG: histidine kinase [Cyclobacteriaceae bacterium]
MARPLNLFLFFVVHVSCFGQSTYDSLRIELAAAGLEQKVDVLNELAAFFQTSSSDSVKVYADKAYLFSKEIGYQKGLVQALTLLGLSKRMHSQYDSSLIFYRTAMELSDSAKTPALYAEILMGIGGTYYYKNSPDSAMNNYVKAAELFETLGRQNRLASAYSNLGMVMNANGQDVKALFYYRKALKYAEENALLNVQLPLLVNLAIFYENRNEYDSALYYADACYQIATQNNMKYGVGRALLILPKIYARQELFELSLKSAREGLALFEESGDDVLVRRMIYQEAIALVGLRQYKSALLNCERLIKQLDANDPFNEQVYLLASEVYERLNKPDKALEYHKLFFDRYKNSSLEKQRDQLTELEAKYDTEKKSREIEALNNKAQLQELKIRQQIGMIAGGLVSATIIILFILLYYRQRELRKKNELLTLQQKLLRSQMNPHFIFNALSAIQKFVIKKDAIEGASFIAKFGALMRQFLEQSRQNWISLEDEVNTLSNYLAVQQLRFDYRFEYAIDVAEEIDIANTFIPPLLAQPFVENAIEHGMAATQTDGRIEISFSKRGVDLVLKISDNGKGLITTKSKDHKSLATAITKDRLHLLRKPWNKPSIEVIDKCTLGRGETGVEVTMIIPLKSRE